MKISLQFAEHLISVAKMKAMEISVPMNIVIIDSSTYLKAFARMDNAVIGSIDVAIKKAKTALLFEMNTEQVFEFCKPGGPSFGLENTNEGLVVFSGGIPFKKVNGETIGSIGVSGGTPAQDFLVANAAAQLFQERKVA